MWDLLFVILLRFDSQDFGTIDSRTVKFRNIFSSLKKRTNFLPSFSLILVTGGHLVTNLRRFSPFNPFTRVIVFGRPLQPPPKFRPSEIVTSTVEPTSVILYRGSTVYRRYTSFRFPYTSFLNFNQVSFFVSLPSYRTSLDHCFITVVP